MTLIQAEAVLVRRALADHPENPQRAAEQLGLTLTGLLRKLDLLGLSSLDNPYDRT